MSLFGAVKLRASLWAPSLLQVAGLAVITAGFWVMALPAGLLCAGVVLCLIGWAVDK